MCCLLGKARFLFLTMISTTLSKKRWALSANVAYAACGGRSSLLRPDIDREVQVEKKDKENPKPESAKPALKQARWPSQGPNSGIKSAKSVHSRMPTGRGSARGR